MMNPLKLLKAYLWVSDIEKNAVMEVKMNGETKPGWKTTEFWLTLVAQVPAVLGIFLGASNPVTIGIGAACTIAYTLGRNWHKGAALSVAQAALTAAADAAKNLPSAPPEDAVTAGATKPAPTEPSK